jgi:hypothetical protein
MRYLFILSGVVCIAFLAFLVPQRSNLLAQSNLEAEIIEMETDRWEGWKDQDPTPYEKYLAQEVVWVGAMGITTGKAQVLEGASGGWSCDVKGYAFDDMKVHRVADSAIIITYKASQDAICGENILPTVIYASTVYVKKGDKWLVACHQETEALKSATS